MYLEEALFGERNVSTANPPEGKSGVRGRSLKGRPSRAHSSPTQEDVAGRYLEAQESERIRLGQELHDSTGQLLVSLKLSIAHYRELQPVGPHDLLQEIDSTVREIEQQIRTFSFLNYPAQLSEQGLIATLHSFARSFARKTGIHIFFRGDGSSPLGAGDASLDLLRVAQEALANVYRHARANSVQMSITGRDGRIELRIKDDGRGLPNGGGPVPEGVGLQSMRYRVERHGGSLTLRQRQKGTEVLAIIPLEQFTLVPRSSGRLA